MGQRGLQEHGRRWLDFSDDGTFRSILAEKYPRNQFLRFVPVG